MLPIEGAAHVTFEWIGQENYLGERISRNGKRTRGANFTSADAAVRFRHADGRIQVVLIEWTYTEAYNSQPYHTADSGTSRVAIYQHLYDRADCPLRKERLPSFGALFYEPFYQFVRQQFLAHEMERARELDADVVSLLHIAPRANADFRRVTAPDLKHLGESATGVWAKLAAPAGRFLSVSVEDLFGNFPTQAHPAMTAWHEYVRQRYRWLNAALPATG
jgi:hypothetical protein